MSLAVDISHVSKEYRLGAIGGGTLRGDIQSLMARIRGREDPNMKLDKAGYNGNERFLALDDVSMQVEKGEALGIIGHNGAGKSTLLKLLSRVTAPTKGTISYNGRIASMLEVGTGFHPELTGRENVYMNGAILGMTKAEISKKFDEIVAFAEMEKFIDTPVKRYSSGMYVKLAFAVAAHLDSEIMVMDEVLAVGDMKFQQKCLGRMGDAANSEGRTVLYVSHNMNTIRQLCKRCVVLDHGKVIFDGDTETAIGLYAGKNRLLRNVIECTDDMRRDFFRDEKIVLKTISLLDVSNPVFNNKDVIKLNIEYEATKEFKHICLRVPISYIDGTIIGMATSMPIIKCKRGVNNITIEIRPENLASGRYSARFVIYSVNDFGTMETHDVVDSAFLFDIDNEATNNINWEHRYWGAISFPVIKIV